MSTNAKISNLTKRDILCTYCRGKFMIELPKEGIGIKIVKCPFCNRKIQILQNKENITLYTIKKNKDRTWKEILNICAKLDDKLCWNYITSLRGPDLPDKIIKIVFTCPLRGKVDPFTMDVLDYMNLSLEDVEKAFLKILEYADKYGYYILGHYILHIEEIWHIFSPKIGAILNDLRTIDNAIRKDFVKELAFKYEKYVNEWLENERIILKDEGL